MAPGIQQTARDVVFDPSLQKLDEKTAVQLCSADVGENGILKVPFEPKPAFQLNSSCIDEARPMRIVAIGAGFSGIAAGTRFPQRVENIDLTIYEKNAGIGGTWYSNRYPGLACDIPAHCNQYTFEENTHWSAFHAPGYEIRAYLERIVDRYKLMRYIKLRHELTHACYDEETGKWHLKIRRPVSSISGDVQYEVVDDVADFVFAGLGSLSRWKWPDIPGLNVFRGKLLHIAETYLAVCTDGFPNLFMSLGPNSAVGSGSLLVLIERQIDYVVAAAKKLQREHLKSIEAKEEVVADFDEYLEHYFQTTVYSEKCRSWYKMGKEEGRVVALWPGSCLHALRTLENPRWEDFDYESLDELKTRNRFYWLGDGSTYNEKYLVRDRAWYLNPGPVDIPPVPE